MTSFVTSLRSVLRRELAETTVTPTASRLVSDIVDDLQSALLADDALGAEPGWS